MNNHAVYIPEEIWGLPLSTEERVLLAHVDYWERKEEACNSTNKQIAAELNCPESRVAKMIKDLDDARFLFRSIEVAAPPIGIDRNPASKRKLYLGPECPKPSRDFPKSQHIGVGHS